MSRETQNKNKTVLIVDDMPLDRESLRLMLESDFSVEEAGDGQSALDIMRNESSSVDAILMDICMPGVDGFDVIDLLRAHGIKNVPICLMTAEPTHEVVRKAAERGITVLFCKPFNRDDIIRKLQSQLGTVRTSELTSEDIGETLQFTSRLDVIYNDWLARTGRSVESRQHIENVMRILVTKYRSEARLVDLPDAKVNMIAKAASFCDVGQMIAVPPAGRKDIVAIASHTHLGVELLKLATSNSCAYFVDICAELCMTHHERVDGGGYPKALKGNDIPIFGQLCHVAVDIEEARVNEHKGNTLMVSAIIRKMLHQEDVFGNNVLSLLDDARLTITEYYIKAAGAKNKMLR